MKRLLRTLILFLVRLLGAPGALLAQSRRQHAPHDTPRILLVRPDHLGDLVMTTPILHALKAQIPQAHITMMVGPWSREVVARHPAIDDLITCRFPGFQRAAQHPLAPYLLLLRAARQLRQGYYDLALNLRPDFWWGAALLYLAGIPQRIGYAITPGTAFLTHALPFPPHEHAAVSNLRLASAALQAMNHAGLAEPWTPEHYPLAFTPTPQERTWVSQQLTQVGIAAQTPLAVIHPGSGAAVKLWRVQAWGHIANWLITATQAFNTPVRIVLTGTASERPLLTAVAQEIRGEPVIFDQMTVGQLAALLGRAQIVLGVDNGPLHLAVAQNTPTLQIFGPTDARIFGPWGPAGRHVVITATRRCPDCPAIPCGRLDFSAQELPAHPCVSLITEQEVEAAISRLLNRESETARQ